MTILYDFESLCFKKLISEDDRLEDVYAYDFCFPRLWLCHVGPSTGSSKGQWQQKELNS